VNGKRISREKACLVRSEREELQAQVDMAEEQAQPEIRARRSARPVPRSSLLKPIPLSAQAPILSEASKREQSPSPTRMRQQARRRIAPQTGSRLRASANRRGVSIASSRKRRRSCSPIRVPPAVAAAERRKPPLVRSTPRLFRAHSRRIAGSGIGSPNNMRAPCAARVVRAFFGMIDTTYMSKK